MNMKIFEKFDEFVNEVKNEENVLYKYEFKPNYTIVGQVQTPKWAWLSRKESNEIREKAAVQWQGGNGYHKTIESVMNRMRWENEKRLDDSAVPENFLDFDELKSLVLKMKKTA